MAARRTRAAQAGTFFAPAERAPREDIERQAGVFRSFALLKQFLDVSPVAALVLNGQRQIVMCNRAVCEIAGVEKESDVIGQRPGEALNCIYWQQAPCGCGTAEFCGACGGVSAILSAISGLRDAQECRLTRRKDGREQALELLVSTSPVWAEGERFVFCTLVDISHEKRRRTLERVFLHDVMGEVAAIQQLAGALRGSADSPDGPEYAGHIISACQRLRAEIDCQRELLAAEAGELSVALSAVKTLSLLQRIAEQLQRRAGAACHIEVDPGSEELTIASDVALLSRVLLNLLNNAVEASRPDDRVTIGCRSAGDEVEFWVHNRAVMPRKVQLQVFQRSFSTKHPTRGLGAYTAKLLSEQYLHGRIGFRSSKGKGTTFFARYPKLGDAPGA